MKIRLVLAALALTLAWLYLVFFAARSPTAASKLAASKALNPAV